MIAKDVGAVAERGLIPVDPAESQTLAVGFRAVGALDREAVRQIHEPEHESSRVGRDGTSLTGGHQEQGDESEQADGARHDGSECYSASAEETILRTRQGPLSRALGWSGERGI